MKTKVSMNELAVLRSHRDIVHMVYKDKRKLIQKRLVNRGLLYQPGSDSFAITSEGLSAVYDHE